MAARTLAGAASLASMLLLLSACGGGEGGAGGGAGGQTDTAGVAPPAAEPAPAPAPGDTAAGATGADTGQAAKPAGGGGGGGGSGPDSPQLVALGDSIFHGQVGGAACTACHGQDAKGTPVGPNLTDNEWLNTDGSYEGIVKTVTTGVPQPKKAPAPMPPKGGATLSDVQVRAVAAYVYSLSH